MEEKLLSHLLHLDCPIDRAETEQLLRSDPEMHHRLEMIRSALKPLASDRDSFDPPADLWLKTMSAVAENIVRTEGPLTEVPPEKCVIKRACSAITPASPACSESVPEQRRGRNLFAAIGLTTAALALIIPGVLHLRSHEARVACQNEMRQFHSALSGYSELNDGKFPMVPEGQHVASIVDAMRETGQLSEKLRLSCPAVKDASVVTLANYAYSLGYRENGNLHGLRRDQGDMYPILADAPHRDGTLTFPINHNRGQNVLFSGGNVMFCTHTQVGLNNDDIFFNANRKVGAGLFPWDSVLGRAEDQP